jgi:thymidine phosphorylase
VGVAAWRLGAGRARKEDPVSPTAGVRCRAKVGDRIGAGQPVLELHGDDESRLEAAKAQLAGAFEIADHAPDPAPLILERIDGPSPPPTRR